MLSLAIPVLVHLRFLSTTSSQLAPRSTGLERRKGPVVAPKWQAPMAAELTDLQDEQKGAHREALPTLNPSARRAQSLVGAAALTIVAHDAA